MLNHKRELAAAIFTIFFLSSPANGQTQDYETARALAAAAASDPAPTDVFSLYRPDPVRVGPESIAYATIADVRSDDSCISNPIITFLTSGPQRTSGEGASVFEVADQPRKIVIGVTVDGEFLALPPAQMGDPSGVTLEAPASNGGFLILDEVTVTASSLESTRHQAEALFEISRMPGEVQFLARTRDYSVCVNRGDPLTPDLASRVAGDLGTPFVWVSKVDNPAAIDIAVRYVSGQLFNQVGPVAGTRRLWGFSIVLPDIATANTAGPESDEWHSWFASAPRAVDRCISVGAAAIRCSGDTHLLIQQSAVIAPRRLSIFDWLPDLVRRGTPTRVQDRMHRRPPISR